MAIVTEYINQVDKQIPVVRDDSLLSLLKPQTQTHIINGKEIPYTRGYHDFGYNQINHFSDYRYSGVENEINFEFVLKSKNKDSIYKYIRFYNQGRGSGTLDMGIDISKEIGLGSDALGIAAISMGRGGDRFAILEVGEYIGIIRTWEPKNAYNQSMGINGYYLYISKQSIVDLIGEVDGRTYDNEFGGISDADGYDPNFDNSSDIITVPNMPSIGVSNVGFVNVYNTTQGALQNLGSDLFPDFEEIPDVTPDTDTLSMLAHGFEYLGKNITTLLKSYINSNLVNYIIDCHCLPVTPTVGETEQIKIGFKEFTQTASRVTSDYVDFDCGALNIKEYYGNFIDYVGTRASLYLPFVGFVPIKNEYFQSGELRVKYRFNIVDGSFMCYVLATSSKSNLKDTVVGTYSGNACVHIPITGVNYSNMVSGVVNGVASVGVSAMTGNVGSAVGGALNMLSMRPQMQSSNSYNATSSFLGIRYPYLLIEREVSNFSEQYPNEYGLPLNVTKTISELTGYVEMDENIHIELNCMNEEKEMIKDLLTGGIII